jgi:hypothetical protein
LSGIELDVVRHHICLADILAIDRGTAGLRETIYGRDEMRNLDRMHRIANVPHPYARADEVIE